METNQLSDKTVFKLMVYFPKKLSRFSNWVLGLGERSTEPKCRLSEPSFDYMKPITVKLKAHEFPPDFRCSHINGESRECKHGCYVLEEGESELPWIWMCKAEDCVGHIWNGDKKSDGEGRVCFGTKKYRLVYIDIPQRPKESHEMLSSF